MSAHVGLDVTGASARRASRARDSRWRNVQATFLLARAGDGHERRYPYKEPEPWPYTTIHVGRPRVIAEAPRSRETREG